MSRLLVISARAHNLADRLRAAFPDHRPVEDPTPEELGAAEEVVVAGGDGTVALAARGLAGKGARLGIVPAGTHNNFALALGLPLQVEAAIAALRNAAPRAVTLGRIGGRPFLEAGSVGVFGDLIALGEAGKELRFGELKERLGRLPQQTGFRYRLTGDVEFRGEGWSLIAANTPSVGARLPISEKAPEEPWLELRDLPAGGRWRVRRVEVTTEPPVTAFADAEPAGQTPVEIVAWPGALQVLVPNG